MFLTFSWFRFLSENKEYYVYVPKESAVNFEITVHSDRVNVTCRRNSDTQFISHFNSQIMMNQKIWYQTQETSQNNFYRSMKTKRYKLPKT
jgi:phage-related tail fiber protein